MINLLSLIVALFIAVLFVPLVSVPPPEIGFQGSLSPPSPNDPKTAAFITPTDQRRDANPLFGVFGKTNSCQSRVGSA